jgi:hypothetical protein
MNYYETIILCQPDSDKSCTACCGLMNFRDISRESLSLFLTRGAGRSSSFISSGDISDQGDGTEIRDRTSYICPHQGLLYNKRPGCLLHPRYRTDTMRNSSFFGEKICDGFLCPAHTILSDAHKKSIIALIDDWYCYTIAVIDPESTAWLLDLLSDRYPIALQREEVAKKIVRESLEVHAKYLNAYHGPVFSYSVSEYNLGRAGYSLNAESDACIEEKKEITAVIEINL